MDRRNFIKSALTTTGLAVSVPQVLGKKQINISYFFQAEEIPKPFLYFRALVNRAQSEVNIEVQSFNKWSSSDLVKSVSNGDLDGVFLLNDVASESIPILKLLGNAADAPNPSQMMGWSQQYEKFWDKALLPHNVKRLSMTHSGAKRGFWVKKDLKEQTELNGANVYARGLYADVFRHMGATVSDNFTAQQDFYVATNLFTARSTGIDQFANLSFEKDSSYAGSKSSQFDLLMNAETWAQLSPKTKLVLATINKKVGERLFNIGGNYDKFLLNKYHKNKQIVSYEVPQELHNKELSREIRIEAALKGANGSARNLVQSFDKTFS